MSRKRINDGLTKHQRYHLKNKAKRNAYNKAYHEANRDTILAKKKEYDQRVRVEDKHEPLVYLLVNENYVGVTENLQRRLWSHKKDHTRDISNVIILGSYETRAEALELEEALHNEGYKGKHKFNLYK